MKWVCKLKVYIQSRLISVFLSSDVSLYMHLTYTHTHTHTDIYVISKGSSRKFTFMIIFNILNVRLRDTGLYNVQLGTERKTIWNSVSNKYPTLWYIKGCTKCVLLTSCMHFTTESTRSPRHSQRIPYYLPGKY
jgi:hypothetical protein